VLASLFSPDLRRSVGVRGSGQSAKLGRVMGWGVGGIVDGERVVCVTGLIALFFCVGGDGNFSCGGLQEGGRIVYRYR